MTQTKNKDSFLQQVDLLRSDLFRACLDFVRAGRRLHVGLRGRNKVLASQMERALVSVPLNVAEARRRRGEDRAYLLRVAAGSAEEVVAAALVAEALAYVKLEHLGELVELNDRIQAMTHRMGGTK